MKSLYVYMLFNVLHYLEQYYCLWHWSNTNEAYHVVHWINIWGYCHDKYSEPKRVNMNSNLKCKWNENFHELTYPPLCLYLNAPVWIPLPSLALRTPLCPLNLILYLTAQVFHILIGNVKHSRDFVYRCIYSSILVHNTPCSSHSVIVLQYWYRVITLPQHDIAYAPGKQVVVDSSDGFIYNFNYA